MTRHFHRSLLTLHHKRIQNSDLKGELQRNAFTSMAEVKASFQSVIYIYLWIFIISTSILEILLNHNLESLYESTVLRVIIVSTIYLDHSFRGNEIILKSNFAHGYS